MPDEFVDLYRYALEQDFLNEQGKIETHRTAVVSIIGNETLDDFEHRLAELTYAEGRFSTILKTAFAGRWGGKGTRRIPDFALGLIFVTTRSEAALEELESEVKRYWSAGITPLIAWPNNIRFANLIKRQLASHRPAWHFARIEKKVSDQSPSSTGVPPFAIEYIEALLIGGTYPGLACVATADVVSVYQADTSARIQRFEASTFDELMSIVQIAPFRKGETASLLATLYGPASLKIKEVHRYVLKVRKQLPKDTTQVLAALADATKERYTLYVAIFD